MAWTAPRTWVTNEVVTASLLNTHVRDNLNALDDRGYVNATKSNSQDHTSSGNWQVINLDAESLDSNAFHDTVTNNSRLTIPTGFGGVYWVYGAVAFAATTAAIGAMVNKNGATVFSTLANGANITGNGVHIGFLLSLAAADYLELLGYQASGGNLAYGVGATGSVTFFGLRRLPPG